MSASDYALFRTDRLTNRHHDLEWRCVARGHHANYVEERRVERRMHVLRSKHTLPHTDDSQCDRLHVRISASSAAFVAACSTIISTNRSRLAAVLEGLAPIIVYARSGLEVSKFTSSVSRSFETDNWLLSRSRSMQMRSLRCSNDCSRQFSPSSAGIG